MKKILAFLGCMAGLAVAAQGLEHELFTASESHILRVNELDDVAAVTPLTPVTLPVADMQVVYESQASIGRIYWVETDPFAPISNVYAVDTNGANRQTIASNVQSIYGIAVDTANGFIYWTSIFGYAIRRAPLSGGPAVTAVNTPGALGYPMGLTLDTADNTLYYATLNGSTGAVGSRNLTTSVSAVVFPLNFAAYGIARDSGTGQFYITDENGHIYVCAPDGSSVTQISGFRGANMHVDQESGKVYAAYNGVLRCINLDGTGLQELGGLPADHDVIAMHKFEYTLTLVGPQETRVGASVTLRIGVLPQFTGSPTYEWYKDGDMIEGANEATHTINPVSHEDAGEYRLQITDQSKRLYISEPFVLTVLDAMPTGGLPMITSAFGVLILAALLVLKKHGITPV